ncbi:MAG: DUF3035 domain-containing protein [Pseudomonadota bacterium]
MISGHKSKGASAARALLVVVIAGLATGCSSFNLREELGLIGEGPDAFTVVKKKPLEMPADMDTLPTPQPGAPSLVDPRPVDDAQIALKGTATPTTVAAAPSGGEAALLRAAGAEQADPEIREKLIEDSEATDQRLLDAIIPSMREEDRTLDPAAEAERLAEEARRTKNPALEPLAQEE